MNELDDIAKRISVAFSQLEDHILELPTEDELIEFEKHLKAQETTGPILRPEQFKDGLNQEAIWAIRERIKLIRGVRKHVAEMDDLFKRDEMA